MKFAPRRPSAVLAVAALVAVLGLVTTSAHPREARAATATRVAKPSFVFPPDDVKWFGLRIPGTHAVKGYTGVAAQVVELRGWLTFVGHQCDGQDVDVPFARENTREPDWHYQLELDPAWLDHLGVKDPNRIILPGNVINAPVRSAVAGDAEGHETGALGTRSAWGVVARPIVHVEVTSWDPARHPGARAPAGWKAIPLPACHADVRWPYDPRNPVAGQPALAVGQYVRMVGSLVTDEPHVSITEDRADYSAEDRDVTGVRGNDDPVTVAVRLFWASGLHENDPANPARWSELHPPDRIDVLTARPRTEVVRSVLVATPSDLPVGGVYTLDATLPLPPTIGSNAPKVVEIVGDATLPRTRRGTSSPTPASRVTVTPAGVQLHVSVVRARGAPLRRFQAVYRITS